MYTSPKGYTVYYHYIKMLWVGAMGPSHSMTPDEDFNQWLECLSAETIDWDQRSISA